MSKYLKWKSFEREVAQAFKKAGWDNAKRNLEEYREASGRDILNTEPYCVQCKHGKKHNVLRAYLEAKTSSRKGEVPIAAIRWEGKETLVCLSFKDFIELLV